MKWPRYRGIYEATGEEEDGSPVYRNSLGRILYRRGDGTWRAGTKIGGSGIYKSVDNAECLTSNSQWQYWATDADFNATWHSGNITVQCSVHT